MKQLKFNMPSDICFHCQTDRKLNNLSPRKSVYRLRKLQNTSNKKHIIINDVVDYWIYDSDTKPISDNKLSSWLDHGFFSFPLGYILDTRKTIKELKSQLNFGIANIGKSYKSEPVNFVDQFENEFCCNYFVECEEGTLDVNLSFNDIYTHEKLRAKKDITRLKSIIPVVDKGFKNVLYLKSYQDFYTIYINAFLRVKFLLESSFTSLFSKAITSEVFLKSSQEEKQKGIEKLLNVIYRTTIEMTIFEQNGLLDLLEKTKLNSDFELTPKVAVSIILESIYKKGKVPFYMTNVCTFFFAFPLNAWQKLKTELTVLYFKVTNAGTMLSVLNNYKEVLEIFLTLKVPDLIEKHSIGLLKGDEKIPKRFDTSSETLQYIYATKNLFPNWFKETTNKDQRSLKINATSVILKPLIRADLHFSKSNTIFLRSRKNQGQIGNLLLTVIKNDNSKLALNLLRNDFHFLIDKKFKINSAGKNIFWDYCESSGDLSLVNVKKQITFAEAISGYLILRPNCEFLREIFYLFYSAVYKINDKIAVLKEFLPWFDQILSGNKRKLSKELLKKILIGKKCTTFVKALDRKEIEIFKVFSFILRSIIKQSKLKIVYVLLQECAKLKLWNLFELFLKTTKDTEKVLKVIERSLLNELIQSNNFIRKKDCLISLHCILKKYNQEKVIKDMNFSDLTDFIKSLTEILLDDSYLNTETKSAILYFLKIKYVKTRVIESESVFDELIIGLVIRGLINNDKELKEKYLQPKSFATIMFHLIDEDESLDFVKSFILSFIEFNDTKTVLFVFHEIINSYLSSEHLSFQCCLEGICILLETYFDSFRNSSEPFDMMLKTPSDKKAQLFINYEECLCQIKLTMLDLSVNGFGFIFDSQLIRFFEYFTNFFLLFLSNDDMKLMVNNFIHQIKKSESDFWYQGLLHFMAKLKADEYFNTDITLISLCNTLKKLLKKKAIFKLSKQNDVFKIRYILKSKHHQLRQTSLTCKATDSVSRSGILLKHA